MDRVSLPVTGSIRPRHGRVSFIYPGPVASHRVRGPAQGLGHRALIALPVPSFVPSIMHSLSLHVSTLNDDEYTLLLPPLRTC
jgi:hypothetical protein